MLKEKEIEDLAKKAVRMKESSLRTLIFATDILLARDQVEKEELMQKTGEVKKELLEV